MKLIDADAYAEKMRKKQNECWKLNGEAKTQEEREYWAGIYMTFVEAKLLLDNTPAVDAVPVVRCENCRYWNREETTCWHHNILTGSRFYCAKAEKKAGEQNDQ